MNFPNFNIVNTITKFYNRVLTFITTGKFDYELTPLKENMDLDSDVVLDFQEING